MFAFSLGSFGQDAQDGPRRGEGPGGMRQGGITPTLNGAWQQCQLAAGEDGQPQLSILPVLKIFNDGNTFMSIGIPEGGMCFLEKQGTLEMTSDSTFVEHVLLTRRDSVQAEPVTKTYKFSGPMFMIVTYTEAGAEQVTDELWMRVQQRARGGQNMGGDGQRGQRMEGQDGQRSQRGQRNGMGGQRGQRNQGSSSDDSGQIPNQVSAFEEDSTGDF